VLINPEICLPAIVGWWVYPLHGCSGIQYFNLVDASASMSGASPPTYSSAMFCDNLEIVISSCVCRGGLAITGFPRFSTSHQEATFLFPSGEGWPPAYGGETGCVFIRGKYAKGAFGNPPPVIIFY